MGELGEATAQLMAFVNREQASKPVVELSQSQVDCIADALGERERYKAALEEIRCLRLGGRDFTSTKKFNEVTVKLAFEIADRALSPNATGQETK
jgi:hypothetical protein